MNMDLSTLFQLLISLAFGGLAGWSVAQFQMGTIKNEVENLSVDFKEVKKDIKELTSKLIEYLVKLDERTNSDSKYIKRKSPIDLTKEGIELINKSGADAFIESV